MPAGMVAITTSMYAMFPQGMEMLFWVAYSFGRHSAAALTHLACLGVLTGAMVPTAVASFLYGRVSVLPC